MLKIRIALILAFCAGALTLIFGCINNTRISPLFYRVIISIAVFAGCGYIMGIGAEKLLARLNASNNIKGQTVDLKADQQAVPVEIGELGATTPSFRPFTSANFEHISQPKQ